MSDNQGHGGQFSDQEKALLEMKYVALQQADAAAEHLDSKLVALIQSDGVVAAAAAVVAVVVTTDSRMEGVYLGAFFALLLALLSIFAMMLFVAAWAWGPKKFGILTTSILHIGATGDWEVSPSFWGETVSDFIDSEPRDALEQITANIDMTRHLAEVATEKKAAALKVSMRLFLYQVGIMAIALVVVLLGMV